MDSPLTLLPVRQCRSISLDWAAIPTMHKKRLLRISLSLVLICGISITLIYSRRAGARAASSMSATTIFLGYTNDPAQGRLALFRLSNSSPVRIQRDYFYAIDYQSPTGWICQFTQQFPSQGPRWFSRHGFGPVLRPGKSEVVAVPAPSSQSCWRISFPYVEAKNKVLRIAAEKFPSLQDHELLTHHDWAVPAKYWSYSNAIDP